MTTPNILLVVFDSVRARNTSVHNHRHDTTPGLVSLAETATTYTQARAADRWSLPSHVSLFTGLLPPEHNVIKKGDQLATGNSVFSTLREAGFSTGLFSENPFLTEMESGLEDGFETIEGKSNEPLFPTAVDPHRFNNDLPGFFKTAVRSGQPVRSLLNGVTTKLAWDYPGYLPEYVARQISGGVSRGKHYTDLFLEWEANQGGPWAACINYMDTHHPYAPRNEHNHWADASVKSALHKVDRYPGGFYSQPDSMWRCELGEFLYDGTIRQVDRELTRIVNSLKRRGEFDDTLLIVTSDHGEGFGERSRIRPVRIAGHAVGGHEVNFHVPLVVKYPGQRQARRISEPVSLTQFPDTVHAVREDPDIRSPDPFVTDQTVVSVGSEPDTELLNQVHEGGLDVSRYSGKVEVVYESAGEGAVFKHMRWKDERATVQIPNARTAFSKKWTDDEKIEMAFESLVSQGIAKRDPSQTVSDETKQRLRELGYR